MARSSGARPRPTDAERRSRKEPHERRHAPPEVITGYQEAHDRHDTEVALSAFALGARVFDDGHEYRGTDEIRNWLATAAREYTFTRSLVRTEAAGAGTWLVVNHLEGDFPGGVVDLRYQFVVSGELITELVIAP